MLIRWGFVVLLAIAAFAAGRTFYAAPANKVETRLERVKRTGVIRCGYFIAPTVTERDPNTGRMHGLSVELFEEMARQLSLKIEWTTEAALPQMPTDLSTGRYDVLCSPLFVTPGRVRETDYLKPVLFYPAYLFVREGDTRFDHNYAAVNAETTKLTTIDGEFAAIAAQENFPKAQKIALPQTANGSDLFLDVEGKKADGVITDSYIFAQYAKKNPGKIRRVEGPPVRVMPVSYALAANETGLKNMLDLTIDCLMGSGYLDRLLDKYEQPENPFLRLPKPYILPQ
ncbi:MAG: substrate-binding periplasmic protein [Bdellovibrionales bacterium]